MKIGHPSGTKCLFAHYVSTANDEKLWRVHRKEIDALGKLGTAETRVELEAYLTRCPPRQKSGIREAIRAIDQRLPR